MSNGTTRITVRDANNDSVSYPVEVSNVHKISWSKGPMHALDAMVWIHETKGETSPLVVTMLIESMLTYYKKPIPNDVFNIWLTPNNVHIGRYSYWDYAAQEMRVTDWNDSAVPAVWSFVQT